MSPPISLSNTTKSPIGNEIKSKPKTRDSKAVKGIPID